MINDTSWSGAAAGRGQRGDHVAGGHVELLGQRRRPRSRRPGPARSARPGTPSRRAPATTACAKPTGSASPGALTISCGLIAAPLWTAAGGPRRVELRVVVALHQQRLGHRLELDRAAEVHVQLAGQQHLRRRVRERRPVGQPPRQRGGRRGQLVVRRRRGWPARSRSARAASSLSPSISSSVARPRPTSRGSRYAEPMSAPARPDLGEQERERRRRGEQPEVATPARSPNPRPPRSR